MSLRSLNKKDLPRHSCRGDFQKTEIDLLVLGIYSQAVKDCMGVYVVTQFSENQKLLATRSAVDFLLKHKNSRFFHQVCRYANVSCETVIETGKRIVATREIPKTRYNKKLGKWVVKWQK